MSPGCIKKQLQNRQTPLPTEDPCKIELIKSNSNNGKKIGNSWIKYQSSGEFNSKRWLSSSKDIIGNWKESRVKCDALPKVGGNNAQN